MRFPWNLLFSGLHKLSSFSDPSQERWFSPLIFVAFSGRTLNSITSCAGHRMPGGASRAEQRGTVTSLFGCGPTHCCTVGLLLMAHVQLSVHQDPPPASSPQGCCQWVELTACAHVWDCSGRGAAPCAWPCWTSFGSCEHTSWACPSQVLSFYSVGSTWAIQMNSAISYLRNFKCFTGGAYFSSKIIVIKYVLSCFPTIKHCIPWRVAFCGQAVGRATWVLTQW